MIAAAKVMINRHASDLFAVNQTFSCLSVFLKTLHAGMVPFCLADICVTARDFKKKIWLIMLFLCISSFQCNCVTGYFGTLCNLDVNECEASPCLHDSVCINKPGGFICVCRTGFSGTSPSARARDTKSMRETRSYRVYTGCVPQPDRFSVERTHK